MNEIVAAAVGVSTRRNVVGPAAPAADRGAAWSEEEAEMQVVLTRCCGLGAHQRTVTVCVLVTGEHDAVTKRVRTFSTMTAGLLLTPSVVPPAPIRDLREPTRDQKGRGSAAAARRRAGTPARRRCAGR